MIWAVIYLPDGELPLFAVYPDETAARKEALRIIHERRGHWTDDKDRDERFTKATDEQLLDTEDLWCDLSRGNENIFVQEMEIGKNIDLTDIYDRRKPRKS